MFAQMFPGMEWIPLMILSAALGLTIGAFGTLAAAINTKSVFARWAAGAACFLGIGMPLLLLGMLGGKLVPVGYLCVAVPLVPGLITVVMICTAIDPPLSENTEPGVPKQEAQPGPRWAKGARFLVAALVFVPVFYLAFLLCIRPLGNVDPSGEIIVGMAADEVKTVLGEPHERITPVGGQETWIYYRDWIGFSYFGIRFDKESRVEFRWLE